MNASSSYSITLDNTGHPDVYTYDNGAFFPVDATPSFGEPEPGSLALLGLGLAGIAVAARRKA